MTPPVDSTYPAYAKEKGFEPEIVTMPSGMKGYWIGDSKSEDVVIWFHGSDFLRRLCLFHAVFSLYLTFHFPPLFPLPSLALDYLRTT